MGRKGGETDPAEKGLKKRASAFAGWELLKEGKRAFPEENVSNRGERGGGTKGGES